MCLTQPATVVEAFEFELLVEIDGRRQRVSSLLVPDARIGDDVVVGMGRALARVTPAEAAELRALCSALDSPAAAVTATRPPSQAATASRRPATNRA